MMKWTKRSLAAVAVATMTAVPAVAQETVSAVVIDGYPDRSLWVREFVRRQGFWDQERPNLRESLAHLVGLIMRRAGGDASGAFRASFV